jgi:hypothetical protein
MARALGGMLRAMQKRRIVRVGFLEGSEYPDGTPTAMVAAIQNYGAPAVGVPPRPFFSNMVADKKAGWPAAIAQALEASDYDAQKTLELVGEGIKGQLQQAIRDFVGAPLKPRTIKRKGFDKQLIDTAHMLNSADFETK